MKIKTILDVDLKNKVVLYRAPYDIALVKSGDGLMVSDDLRIKATLPTLEYLIEQNCKIIVLTYVKRPDGKVIEELRTTPHAKRLGELLGRNVYKVDDCVGPEAEEAISKMSPGDILMLENARFHKEEMLEDENFSKELCKGKDIIVFDGFPQAHRRHSSTTGIQKFLPSVAGLYLKGEVDALSNMLESPTRPLTVIIGGAKISDKVDAVNNLIKEADTILIGGAVANVFLKAQGVELGKSFVEDVFVDEAKKEKKDFVLYAKDILKDFGTKIICPIDLVISDGFDTRIIDISKESVPDSYMALDIGPKTITLFEGVISKSKTVFINGPMGKFEDEKFSQGSKYILESMARLEGSTIVAGGDTIDVARKLGLLDRYTNISLAGGATLEFLAGKELPALKAFVL